jgi:hypothetical protein
MNSDALIEALARDVQPVARHAVGRRLLFGMLGGGLVTLALIVAMLGVRPDLDLAMHGFAFWMKLIYAVSLGIGALAMVARLSRPEPQRLRTFWPIVVPFAALAAVSAVEMAQVPASDWTTLWLGHSWKICPWLILTLSVPIFAGLSWSFRRLAPTQLRAAGAAAGFAAGAGATTLYCLHCPEVSALFVLTWYTLGIALASGLGSLIGPRLLRW